MTIYYSPANKGFYADDVQSVIPQDAIQIDEDTHQALLAGLSAGKTIVFDSGRLILVDFKVMSVELQRDIAAVVQEMMDTKANELGYDSIFSAVTYADEHSVSKFQREGAALRAWRSLVWMKCYLIVEEVKAGKQFITYPAQVLAQLPQFTME